MKVAPAGIVSVIVAFAALVNLVLGAFGIAPIPVSEGGITAVVTGLVALVGIGGTAWHNFSVTDPAKAADHIAMAVKSGDVTIKQVTDAVDNLVSASRTVKIGGTDE